MAKFNGFNGDYTGLSKGQVAANQAKYGFNEQQEAEKPKGAFSKIIELLKEPMFLLLFVTASIYFLLGEPRDGIIMLCFVLFMSFISLYQEWRTDKTLQALRDLSSPRAQVIRDGGLVTIDSRELTVGDLMTIEEGDKIPADCRLIELFDLGVDESSLTGESEAVWKTTEPDQVNHFKRNYCYAGTSVIQGSALAEVEAIGSQTQFGAIGKDVMSAPDRPTPLEKQTSKLVRICAVISLAFFLIVTAATFFNTGNVVDSLLAGVTLAMAIIPEEFPVILTIFLAMGAWRLARKSTLVRRMPSVETLGAVTVLCVDKTGTLTQNQMTVTDTYCHGITEKELMEYTVLGCETEPYDPMEKAILSRAATLGIDAGALFGNRLLHEYPFNAQTRMMGHVWQLEGGPVLASKGSPESILPLCGLSEAEKKSVEEEQHKLAEKGYRVIAVASCKVQGDIPQSLQEYKMGLVGLVGLEDPPREAVPGAVKVCQRAGIRVVMITGDNGTTAASIARRIGIAGCGEIITGEMLEAMPDEKLKDKVRTCNVFSRVLPRHKMRIVKALKESGEIVAMTGDGVNDAPALKYADIGIAMGKRGTGVAREAADMVLLDDNFTTIVEAVHDGRRIFDNILKSVGYVLVIHIPIALLALFAPLLGLPALLLPIHVVLLELIIDPTCSVVFERLPAEKDVMERGPRSPKTSILNKQLVIRSLIQGMLIFLAAFLPYFFLLQSGCAVETARSFSLLVLIFSNLFIVFINHSELSPAYDLLLRVRDSFITGLSLLIAAVILLVIYLPGLNAVAETAPLSLSMLLSGLGAAIVATFWREIPKAISRHRARSFAK